MMKDERVGWHHQLNRHETAKTPGDSEGQGILACFSPWGRKELDMTDRLNSMVGFVDCNTLSLLAMARGRTQKLRGTESLSPGYFPHYSSRLCIRSYLLTFLSRK